MTTYKVYTEHYPFHPYYKDRNESTPIKQTLIIKTDDISTIEGTAKDKTGARRFKTLMVREAPYEVYNGNAPTLENIKKLVNEGRH